MLFPGTAFHIERPPLKLVFCDILVFWLHYSILVFTNTEVAGIQPVSSLSKIIVILEILTKILFSFLVVNTFIKKDSDKSTTTTKGGGLNSGP
jgi:hypothetical protein